MEKLVDKSFQRNGAQALWLLLILAALMIEPTDAARAFKPTNRLRATPSDRTHQSITEEVIKELDAEFFGVTKHAHAS